MITNLHIGYNGRLGNQLFQFASVLGIARLNGYDFVIPKSNTNPNFSNTMDGKPCVYRLEISECFEIENLLGDPVGITQMAQEKHFHFDQVIIRIPDGTTLNGYFQSERYFEHCREELIEILSFKDSVVKRSELLIPKNGKTLVSIHVRRGDYLHPNPYHPVIGLEYFDHALQHFLGDDYHFMVFSDDTDWCRQTWGEDERFTVVDTGNNFVDLCTMSMCDHNIITNSSFSWWGSYLNKNNEKKVIAPSGWFGPGYATYDLSDLYTKNMIVI